MHRVKAGGSILQPTVKECSSSTVTMDDVRPKFGDHFLDTITCCPVSAPFEEATHESLNAQAFSVFRQIRSVFCQQRTFDLAADRVASGFRLIGVLIRPAQSGQQLYDVIGAASRRSITNKVKNFHRNTPLALRFCKFQRRDYWTAWLKNQPK